MPGYTDRGAERPTRRANGLSMTLEEAQAMEAAGASPEQERQARAAGFRDYAQMRAYLMQRSRKTGGTARGGNGVTDAADSGSSRTNAMSWHPAHLFSYIQRKWNEAMGD